MLHRFHTDLTAVTIALSASFQDTQSESAHMWCSAHSAWRKAPSGLGASPCIPKAPSGLGASPWCIPLQPHEPPSDVHHALPACAYYAYLEPNPNPNAPAFNGHSWNICSAIEAGLCWCAPHLSLSPCLICPLCARYTCLCVGVPIPHMAFTR